jgi:hypothetical protein
MARKLEDVMAALPSGRKMRVQTRAMELATQRAKLLAGAPKR